MVRSAAAVRALRRGPTAESALVTERALRRLVDENRRLRRELGELRKLERWARQDPVTGLPNRCLFDERLAEELSRASRDPGQIGALLVADLNTSRSVGTANDRFGHAVGDQALRETAWALRGALRTADVCCRTDGGEFMILLPETDSEGARLTANRLRAAVFRAGARRDVGISLSIGAATWPADGDDASRLIAVAHAAMYAEKRRLRARARASKAPAVGAGGLALVKPLVK